MIRSACGRVRFAWESSVVIRLACAGFAALFFHSQARAQDWPRFRGTNGAGISWAKNIPSKWTEKDFNWKVELPGSGHSSPVLWGDRIFLLSGDESQGAVMVLCLGAADGHLAWRKDFTFPLFAHHQLNAFASSTPAVDNRRVYVCWSRPERYTLAALTHAGDLVWERDLGPFVSQHSGGTSPIVLGDKVILANYQDGQSFVIAVAADTGKTIWQTPRKTTQACYSTPFLYQPPEGKPLLIFTSQSHGFSAVEPETGKAVWEYPDAFDKRTVASPIAADGLLVGSCGSGGGGMYAVAIKPPARAGQRPELAYQVRRSAPYVPTPIGSDGLLFLWGDNGIVSCLEAKTGAVKWEERAGGNFLGSPVWVDGRVFCISTAGEVVVLRAADRFEVLARNNLDEGSESTPAVAGGRMYLRTSRHLISVGKSL